MMSTHQINEPARPPRAEEWIAQGDKFLTRRGHSLAFRKQGTGPVIVMLHGFPTWSYDYSAVAFILEREFCVVTMDFLGYGASDKPSPYDYSVSESAESVEDLAAQLKLDRVHLVVHDYGGIVGQELVDRQHSNKLPFHITGLAVLNSGVVYSEYRPTLLQRLLITPVVGGMIANRVTAGTVRSGLKGVWGNSKLSDEEFNDIWHGMSLNEGHKLAHLHIRYNTERAEHHRRWEAAFAAWKGPLHLIWGLDDPVSGRHVLEKAKGTLARAVITELDGVGHYPQVEAPTRVAEAIRASATTPDRASL